MKWLDYYNFESDGITIGFAPLEPIESEVIKYSFSVLGNKELTNKLLYLVDYVKVDKFDISSFALKLFNLVKEKNLRISVENNAVKKGKDEKIYYEIKLIHHQGALVKNFTLYEVNTSNSLKYWENIFSHKIKEDYAKFLEQFEMKIPEELIKNNEGVKFKDALKEFKNNFKFK
jgi:hypothetical protein